MVHGPWNFLRRDISNKKVPFLRWAMPKAYMYFLKNPGGPVYRLIRAVPPACQHKTLTYAIVACLLERVLSPEASPRGTNAATFL